MNPLKELRVWTGPMGSAKTTGALHVARRYERLKYKVILVRPTISIRTHEEHGVLVTKNGERYPAYECDEASGIVSIYHEHRPDVLWIDEPFLFRNEKLLFDYIVYIRRTSIILVSAIGCNSEQEPFGETTPKLIASADEINWCKADCDSCGGINQASRHTILVKNTPGEPCPGGVESYAATCVSCWNSLIEFPPEDRRANFKIRQIA